MADDVRVVPDQRAIALLGRDPAVRQFLMEAVAGPVRLAQARAPRRTGALAAGIHAEPRLTGDGWEADVSWARDQYYGRYIEFGTQTLPPHPFLIPAFEGGASDD